MTEGAGQVRSISRLALETVIGSGNMVKLQEAINDLYKVEEDKVEQALRVVLVSSLAGGTGSGLILPVALYVRNYLGLKANITRGFFILPEVFFEVIQGHSERNNLKANAYAALRELDAFLMKADDILPEKYKDTVTMKFPMPGTEYKEFEEYIVRPYDFCFLFDAQNAEGAKLNSFAQYLDHAANCIYAQSIGPMNKRSNSSEDNTIRKLVREKGRNRYAGAGAAVLKYPFEDVRKFIALQWAKECVSKQWLVYDMEYKALCEANRAREEEGVGGPAPDAKQQYVMSVENGEARNDPFSRIIVRSCQTFKPDGVTKESNRWDTYVYALKQKTKAMENVGANDLKSKKESIENLLGSLGNKYKAYREVYDDLVSYYNKTRDHVENNSRNTAFLMFSSSREFRKTKPEQFEIEYYLTTLEGNFIHPNAIRYFLIKAYNCMKLELANASNKVLNVEKELNAFGEDTFDDPNTPGVVEDANSLDNRKVPVTAQLSNKPTPDQIRLKGELEAYLENVDTYKTNATLKAVLEAGCEYVTNLIDAFDMFYGSFEVKVSGLEKTISDIRKKYTNRQGSTMRYVCADAVCLDGVYEKKKYMGSATAIDPQLSKDIYYKVLEYARMTEKPANNRFFSELFDKGIIGYYEDYVMKKYGDTIDIDIIQALETEAVILHPEYEEESNANELIEQYVKKVITNTRALSCPFIESPIGEVRDPINACAFNKEMAAKYMEDPSKADLIKKELMNFGGVADDEIAKNEVMFYQSFYGLRANDLSKFAPPEKSLTYSRNAGEYFKAYYELVTKIHPECLVSREISPHLDRWWHVITKMPDLDDDNQERQEYDINAAFFWALINKYVYAEEEGSGKIKYVIDKEELDMESSNLVVSNGTLCDKLYEVLDAIAIYPEFSRKILERVATKKNDDLNKNRTWDKGILFRGMNKLELEIPGLGRGKDVVPARSIFSIPLMMKKSSNPNIYYEENVIDILRVELLEVKKYLAGFFEEKDVPEYLCKVIVDQFKLYLADLEVEAKVHTNIYRESLFSQTCAIIAKTLENYDFDDEAQEIKDEAERLKKSAGAK